MISEVKIEIAVAVRKVIARPFTAQQGKLPSKILPKSLLPESNPVQGWLVGATDGRDWGWWGPVSEQVAGYAVNIFDAIDQRWTAAPPEWAERARRRTRHAHTGLGSVAIGAFELAVWDLLGQIVDRPVWALFRETPAVSSIEAYATCFGFHPKEAAGQRLAYELVDRGWRCQKWRPPDGEGDVVDELCKRAGGGGRLALDFGGLWPGERVASLLAQISSDLAWIEEPLPPWKLADLALLSTSIPIAAGEHCYGPHETVMLETAGVSIWQPDAVFCGGWDNLLRIASRAASVGARCIPHGGGLLPSLHAAACGIPIELVEWHLGIEPRRQAHLANPVGPLETTHIPIPHLPGWGGRLDTSLI